MLKTRSNLKLVLFLAMFFLIPACVCFAQSNNSTLPSAELIIAKSESVLIPNFEYGAKVSQQAETPQSPDKNSGDFTHEGYIDFSPKDGLKRIKNDSEKSDGSIQTPTIMVDLGKFLKELSASNPVIDDIIDINGSPHFLIRNLGNLDQRECKLYIDKENYYISRINVNLLQKPFAEISVSYTSDQNMGLWLPDKIEIHHATDGSNVTLVFSEYTFNN